MTKNTRVLVTIKKDVLDPAGAAVKKALMRQGFSDLADVRIGKVIDIAFKGKKDIRAHLPMLEQAAKTILTNPIMEDFTIEIIDEKQDER